MVTIEVAMPRRGYVPEVEPLSEEMRKKEQRRLAAQAAMAGKIAGQHRTEKAEKDRTPGWEGRRRKREQKRASRERLRQARESS